MSSLSSHYLTLDSHTQLHYLEKGEGQPLIFLPGLTFSGQLFQKQLDYFSTSYRVIALDPRGQGLSSKSVDGNDYVTHGQDLNTLMNTLELTDVVLVGWSTGNFDAWSYLKQFGHDRLSALVTIDMSPAPLSPHTDWWVEGSIEELSQVATEVLNTPEGTREFFDYYAKEVMFQHSPSQEDLELVLSDSNKTPYWIAKALFTDVILSNYLETAQQIAKDLPSLMFIAEHWANLAQPFVEKHLPGCQTHVMGGHLMFYENAQEWNSTLERFLESLR